MKSLFSHVALAMLLVAALVVPAHAVEFWDFSTAAPLDGSPAGTLAAGTQRALGQAETFASVPGGFLIEASAWYVSGGVLVNSGAFLFQRNLAPNDLGLGACNPGDAGGGPGGCDAQGEGNEIDNNGGVQDVIILDTDPLGTGHPNWKLVGLGLSSVDGTEGNIDNYVILVGNDITGAGAIVAAFGDETTGGINPFIDLSAFNDFKFIFVTTFPGGGDDDFLVSSLVGERVPEPSVLLLLGSGLVGLSAIRGLRRRR